jgi:hypothetical protein
MKIQIIDDKNLAQSNALQNKSLENQLTLKKSNTRPEEL